MKARGTIGNRPDGIRNVKGVRIFRAQGCIQQNRLWPFYCAACLFTKSLLSGLLFNVNSKVNVKLRRFNINVQSIRKLFSRQVVNRNASDFNLNTIHFRLTFKN